MLFSVVKDVQPCTRNLVVGRQLRVDSVQDLALGVRGHRIPTHVHHLVRADLPIQHQFMFDALVSHGDKNLLRIDQVRLDLVNEESRVHFDGAVLLTPRFCEQVVCILADRLESVEHLHHGEVLHLGDGSFKGGESFGQEELAIVGHDAQKLLQEAWMRSRTKD